MEDGNDAGACGIRGGECSIPAEKGSGPHPAIFEARSDLPGHVVYRPRDLAGRGGPTLYVLGGKQDIAWANGTDDYARIGHIPSALVNIPVGHGGTYMQPHGGVGAEIVTAWLDWQLKGDRRAAARFVGADCGYCRDPRLTIENRRLR